MIPYTFILGMSHSGSTLLAFLLNAHPEIVTVGETSRITEMMPARWERKQDRCSCGRSFYHCRFWNRSLAGLAARGFGLGHPDFFVYEPHQEDLAHKKLAALVESFLEISHTTVYLDASKHTHCVPALLGNSRLALSIIDLYRDGRGIVNSWRKNNPNATITQLTRIWVKRERARQDVLQGLPENKILPIQYESFCQGPREYLDRIFGFMHVQLGVDVLTGYKTAKTHHIIGNQMRLSDNEAIVLDEKWRREMGADLLEEFDQAGGTVVNQENGYLD